MKKRGPSSLTLYSAPKIFSGIILIIVSQSYAADLTWTNLAGGLWSSPSNWTPNVVPATGDNVWITNAGTYTVTLDVNATLSALRVGATNGTQTLASSAQTLTLNGPGVLETNTVFSLSGGTLEGTGELLVKGGFNWSGGTMDSLNGGGRTVFTNSASVVINSGNTKVLYRRTIQNYTTVSWSGGAIASGLSAGWNNAAGAVFDVQGDLSLVYSGGGNFLSFNNDGTLKKSAGAGAASLVAAINNANLVTSLSGTLSLDGGGTSSGGFNANNSCVLNFGGGVQTLLSGASFSGTGLHRINNSGTVNFAGPITINPAFELAPSGIIDGTNVANFAGPFTWSGGNMDSLNGGGRTVFTNSASVVINSGNTKVLYRRMIQNYTTVSWSGGAIASGLSAGWNNAAGAVFDVQGDLSLVYSGGGNFLSFNNDGTLKKSAGAGAASLVAAINNANLVTSLSGTLSLDGGGTSSGGFNANSSCVLNFGGGVQTLLSGASFSGAGLHRINNSGTVNFAGPITINPAFELAPSGIIDGTNVANFAGPFTWSGGNMDSLNGGGRTVFTNSASVVINSGNTKVLYRRTIQNYTTVSWSGGAIASGLSAGWNNAAGAVFDVQGDLSLVYSGGGNFLSFNNDGTLKKSAGAGAASLVAAINNANLVTSLSGTLSLDGGGTSSGGFNANSSCVLNFGGGVQTLLSGASFSGAGLHRINNSGTVNFAGPITINPAFELAPSGMIDGTNAVNFAGPFTWSGGNMDSLNGGGRTVFTNSASVVINSGNTKVLYRRTIQNYTTVSWSGGAIASGLSAGWNNAAGAVFDVQGDLSLVYSGGGNFLSFNNDGTLKKSAGAGAASLVAAVNNANLVTSLNGTLSLDGGGTSSGGFNANSSGVLNFGGGVQTLLSGASFSGAGLHRINNSGTVNFAGPITINPAFELAPSGIIDGTNVVNFAGPFTWSGGNMDSLNGGGRTVFTNSASVVINSGNTKVLYRRTIQNYTTVNWSGGAIASGLSAGWNNAAGAVFDVQGDLSLVYSGGGNFLSFNNDGTLKKSAGAGAASLVAAINNANLVASLSGTLSLDGGGTSSGGFNANNSCVLNFGGGVQTLLSGASFSGTGLHRINNSGTVNFAGPITINPAFELAPSGIIDGTNVANFAGPFTWSGGNMDSLNGGGRTVFTNSASVVINSGNTKVLYRRTIQNYTTVSWSGGAIASGLSAGWNNAAGAVLDVQGDLSLVYSGGGNFLSFNNDGTLKKSAGAGAASLVCNVTNAGTVRSQSGTFGLPQTYLQTAGLTELAGGNFSGNLFNNQGGLITGAGNIAADVNNNAQVAPGSGVGRITLSSTVPQTYSSTTSSLVTFQIGGLAPSTGHDQLVVGGPATLSGTLRAELANGYVPTGGNTFTVMTFTARSGLFTNFSFPDYEFGVVQNSTNVILIASNALPYLSLLAPTQQLVCATFQLRVTTGDLDGTVTNLAILLNSNLIASVDNPSALPYKFDLSYDFPGPATFTARATDNKGGIRQTNVVTSFYTMPLHVLSLGGFITNHAFKFCMAGQNGKNYEVLATDDLRATNWTSVGVMEVTNGIWRFLDPAATNFIRRYYRARQLP